MGLNARLSAVFEQAARVMELVGADGFRVNAIARASRVIDDHSGEVALTQLPRIELIKVPGIGPKIADMIVEFAATGTVAEFDRVAAEVPPGVIALMDVPGLGPKTVAMLWKDGGVHSAADLSRIIEDGSILKLPRMGAKSVEKLRQALAFKSSAGQRLSLGLALPMAERLIRDLRKTPGVLRAEIAGSIRRGMDTVGNVDLLVAASVESARALVAAFRDRPDVTRVIHQDEGSVAVMMTLAAGSGRWGGGGEGGGGAEVRVDLRVVAEHCFGASWILYTGSAPYAKQLQAMAHAKGLDLAARGLVSSVAGSDSSAALATEEDVFASLGLAMTPPERRELVLPSRPSAHPASKPEDASGLFDTQGPRQMPPALPSARGLDSEPSVLITVGDIKAELHAHTTASDGRLSIDELAGEALRRGFHTLAITDHSRSSAQANGLPIERLLDHIEAIHAARERFPSLRLLAGSEVDILADGSLDYPDEILARLDWVVASPHAALSQDDATSTARLVAAVRNPFVHVLGHPTGRLVNRRPGLSPRMDEVFAAAQESGVALEINSHWMRLDLRDVHVMEALAVGCLISINCDTHEREDLDNLRYGVLTGRRGGLTAQGCLNAWTADRLEAWRRLKRPGIS